MTIAYAVTVSLFALALMVIFRLIALNTRGGWRRLFNVMAAVLMVALSLFGTWCFSIYFGNLVNRRSAGFANGALPLLFFASLLIGFVASAIVAGITAFYRGAMRGLLVFVAAMPVSIAAANLVVIYLFDML